MFWPYFRVDIQHMSEPHLSRPCYRLTGSQVAISWWYKAFLCPTHVDPYRSCTKAMPFFEALLDHKNYLNYTQNNSKWTLSCARDPEWNCVIRRRGHHCRNLFLLVFLPKAAMLQQCLRHHLVLFFFKDAKEAKKHL